MSTHCTHGCYLWRTSLYRHIKNTKLNKTIWLWPCGIKNIVDKTDTNTNRCTQTCAYICLHICRGYTGRGRKELFLEKGNGDRVTELKRKLWEKKFPLKLLYRFAFQQNFESKWAQTIVRSLNLTHNHVSHLRDPRLQDFCLAFMVNVNYNWVEIVFFLASCNIYSE